MGRDVGYDRRYGGGGDDSITWTYNVSSNTWTDLNVKTGPGNPWVGAMEYDPEHNVFVLFHSHDKQVWAFRSGRVFDSRVSHAQACLFLRLGR